MAYGFKGFGWFLCGVIVALTCYMVTSRVAAERAQLDTVIRSIAQAHGDLRDLETEFITRANLAQLERWNGDVLALAAPSPQQFVASETALASLDAPAGAPIRTAALIVPAGEAATQPQTIVPAAPATASSGTAAARVEMASAAEPAAGRHDVRGAIGQAKGQAMAMLDRKLLSDSTLGDLLQGARAEASALR